MTRVVVTGGAGFLGSHLCRALLDRGEEVVCVDNLVTGTAENIAPLLERPGFTFVRHDVSNRIDIAGPVDRVMHFASPASPVDYLELPIQTLKVGSLGTHNTLGLARAKGAAYFLASTSEVYGDPEVHPQPETYRGSVDPIGPRGVYDEAKRFAEAMCMAYHRVHGLDVRIARIFNTYGPRMRPDDGRVVSAFVTAALRGEPLPVHGDGSQTRSYAYVDDTIAGVLALCASDHVGPVNIGSGEEVTVGRLAELVLGVTGSSSPILAMPRPVDDPERRRPDLTLARSLLDWSPGIDLETGLKATADWFGGIEHERHGGDVASDDRGGSAVAGQ